MSKDIGKKIKSAASQASSLKNKKMVNRSMKQHLKAIFRETDYFSKLNQKELEFYIQFMYEYYQADFNFLNPIHGPEHVKECRDRNNASKRQFHSVGQGIRDEAERRARYRVTIRPNQYYTPDDYYDKGPYDKG